MSGHENKPNIIGTWLDILEEQGKIDKQALAMWRLINKRVTNDE